MTSAQWAAAQVLLALAWDVECARRKGVGLAKAETAFNEQLKVCRNGSS
jgi:hypothetical protein